MNYSSQVSPKIWQKIMVLQRDYIQTGRSISDGKWLDTIRRRLCLRTGEMHLKKLENHGISLQGKNILDVGSGMGDFLLACWKAGGMPVGVEPDTELIDFSKIWIKSIKAEVSLCLGVGEKLPFDDKIFDIVSSNHVIEHCKNPTVLMRESTRVLKPGGILYLNFPNYIFPYEQHYHMFWFPFMPKSLGKIYLRLRRRPVEFINQINCTNVPSITGILRRCDLKIEADTMQMLLQDTSVIASQRWRKIAKLVKALNLPRFLVNLLSPTAYFILVKQGDGNGNEIK